MSRMERILLLVLPAASVILSALQLERQTYPQAAIDWVKDRFSRVSEAPGAPPSGDQIATAQHTNSNRGSTPFISAVDNHASPDPHTRSQRPGSSTQQYRPLAPPVAHHKENAVIHQRVSITRNIALLNSIVYDKSSINPDTSHHAKQTPSGPMERYLDMIANLETEIE